MKLSVLSAAAIAGLLPFATGCEENDHHHRDRDRVVVREERVIVVDEPPRERVEVIGAPPSRDHIYIKGHWERRGRDWDWVPGRWVARPRRGVEYEQGRWVREGRGWVWVEGRWR